MTEISKEARDLLVEVSIWARPVEDYKPEIVAELLAAGLVWFGEQFSHRKGRFVKMMVISGHGTERLAS